MCADAVSMGNLVTTVAHGYEVSRFQSAPEVLQYADFAQWQEELHTAAESEAGSAYWREYCSKVDFTELSCSAPSGRSSIWTTSVAGSTPLGAER